MRQVSRERQRLSNGLQAAGRRALAPIDAMSGNGYALNTMRRHRLFLVALLLLVAWLYEDSLHFGYVWDDPLFFGRLLNRPLAELLQPIPGFHFYRPGVMLYNRLFAGTDGIFDPFAHHAAQLAWHLLNASLLYALARRLKLPAATACAAALLFALHPFSQQAIVWTQAQHLLVTTLQLGAWLAFLVGLSRRARGPLLAGLVLFLLALTVQESTVPMALVPLLFLWATGDGASLREHFRDVWRGGWWTRVVFLFPLLAALYTILWIVVPRQPGVTTIGRELLVAEYVLQAFIYPILGRSSGYAAPEALSAPLLLALFVVSLSALLAILYVTRRRGRQGLFNPFRLSTVALLWALLGVLPTLTGLPYSYVKLGPRLVYVATPGISLFWAVIFSRWRRSAQLLGYALLGLIAWQSILLVGMQQKTWRQGTVLQAAMVDANEQQPQRPQLYVNYPDRYSLKRPPYPLGYWGVTLAPVLQRLNDFTELQKRQAAPTISLSAPWIDAPSRAAGPYDVDFRGAPSTSGDLYAAAISGDDLFLVQTGAAGAFALRPAGRRLEDPSGAGCLVTFGDAVCLLDLRSEPRDDDIAVSLTWRLRSAASAQDTVFLHWGRRGLPPIVQADGDLWLGLLPLTVPTAGDVIQEWRYLPNDSFPAGEYAIGVGIYRRDTGERLPAIAQDGARLPDDIYLRFD